MTNREYNHRVILNSSSTLNLAGPVQQQEGLRSGETYVCQFDVWDSDTIRRGDSIVIYHKNRATNVNTAQFKGVVSKTSASRYPHRMTVYCQGPLARLRRARLSTDKDFTGYTDGEVVIYLLDYCGITYDPADIADAGFVMPSNEAIIWKVGQRAADFLAQLDEFLAMATIETYAGRVVRFAYDMVPSNYPAAYATYRANTSGDPLYDSNRDRGNLDAVRNVVKVSGATWECGPDGECSCSPFANGTGTYPLLPAGTFTEPLTFSSEFIQNSATALAVATRLLMWNNREPDTMSVDVANDPNVMPGRPINILDAAYGIDLGSDRRYLVTGVVRDGDIMTLTLEGGTAGNVGSIDSGIDQECNQDGSSGTDDGGGFDPPPVDVPPVTGPVDVPPITGGGAFTDCETTGSVVCDEDLPPETCLESGSAISSCSGTPPEGVTPCQDDGWHRVSYHDAGELYDCTCEVASNLFGLASNNYLAYHTTAGEVDKVTTCNYEGDPSLSAVDFTISPDIAVGQGIVLCIGSPNVDVCLAEHSVQYSGNLCVDFEFQFCNEGDEITVFAPAINADGELGSLPAHAFHLYAVPGTVVSCSGTPDCDINANSTVFHNEGSSYDPSADIHTSVGFSAETNGGVSIGDGLPLDTPLHASICWQMEGDNPPAYWDNGVEAGYLQHIPYFFSDHSVEFPGEPSNDTEPATHIAHAVEFVLTPGADFSVCDQECPGPMVWGIVTGGNTCAVNPDYPGIAAPIT